jgi:hypothetical protein
VHLFAMLLGLGVCLTCKASADSQLAVQSHVWANLDQLRGRDLACWCALDGTPCHADVLLALANEPLRKGMLDRFLAPEVPA